MDSQPLLDKLQRLRQRFSNADPSDRQTVDGWFNSAQRAALIQHLAEHEGMRELLERMRGEALDIDAVLLEADSHTIDGAERDRLIDRRNLYRLFLEYFEGAYKTLQTVETNVQNNAKWTE
jgi:hypothetical protein